MGQVWAASLDLARIARNASVAIEDLRLLQQALVACNDGPKGQDKLIFSQGEVLGGVAKQLREAADEVTAWATRIEVKHEAGCDSALHLNDWEQPDHCRDSEGWRLPRKVVECKHPEGRLATGRDITDEAITWCKDCGASSDGGPWVPAKVVGKETKA